MLDRRRQLGGRIRQLRLERHLTQSRLAELAETDQAHLARVERGERWPSVPLLFRLADALETDVARLFRPDAEEPQDVRDDMWLVLRDATSEQQALARDMLRLLRSSWRLKGGDVAPGAPEDPRDS